MGDAFGQVLGQCVQPLGAQQVDEVLVGEHASHCRPHEGQVLLHQIGFRSNATDDEVREHLDSTLERQWFRVDLHGLNATDDPRAAMAFACVRSAFFVRCAMLMGWIDTESGWRIMLLNAQRAQDCFSDWEDFGRAFMLGRNQWIAAFRADSLGEVFNETSLNRLLMPGSGIWAGVAWQGLPALLPVAD